MPGIRVSVDVNRTALQQKLLAIVDNDTTRRGVNQIIADMIEPYVPMKTGALRRSVRVGPKVISWGYGTAPGKYARYQYHGEIYGPNIPIMRKGVIVGWYSQPGVKKHPTGRELGLPGSWRGWTFGYTTPGTKHHWDKLMLQNDKRAMQIRITNYLKRRAKEMSK